jgi:HlyD family secretion protein
VVKQGPLRISVTESGTIKAREQVILKSEVEGRTSILSLIPEGTQVKQGDLLVDLDSSQLLDSKIDQEIIVQKGWIWIQASCWIPRLTRRS